MIPSLKVGSRVIPVNIAPEFGNQPMGTLAQMFRVIEIDNDKSECQIVPENDPLYPFDHDFEKNVILTNQDLKQLKKKFQPMTVPIHTLARTEGTLNHASIGDHIIPDKWKCNHFQIMGIDFHRSTYGVIHQFASEDDPHYTLYFRFYSLKDVTVMKGSLEGITVGDQVSPRGFNRQLATVIGINYVRSTYTVEFPDSQGYPRHNVYPRTHLNTKIDPKFHENQKLHGAHVIDTRASILPRPRVQFDRKLIGSCLQYVTRETFQTITGAVYFRRTDLETKHTAEIWEDPRGIIWYDAAKDQLGRERARIPFDQAVTSCQSLGRRLPNELEIMAMSRDFGYDEKNNQYFPEPQPLKTLRNMRYWVVDSKNPKCAYFFNADEGDITGPFDKNMRDSFHVISVQKDECLDA